jgi:Rieske Fe-S protein
MSSTDKRQVYRVTIKVMLLLGAIVLGLVLIRSIWKSAEPVADHINLSTEVPQSYPVTVPSGKVQLIRWGKQEINILHLTPEMQSTLVQPSTQTLNTEPYLNATTRSRQPEYFVYVNKGSGVGCPIGFVNDFKRPTLRDTCTQSTYDLAGRPLNATLQVPNLTVPPHHFKQAGQITIGAWE